MRWWGDRWERKPKWKKSTEEGLSSTGDDFRNTLFNTGSTNTTSDSTKSIDTATGSHKFSLWPSNSISMLWKTVEITALTSADEQPSHKPHSYTLPDREPVWENDIIINQKSPRGQGWFETCPIGIEMTLAKWLLHTLGPAMTKASRATVHPSSHTSAGLIEHPITDRWME